jgi:hypothetical protein
MKTAVVCVSRVAQSVHCLATSWTTGRSRFDSQQRQKNFPRTCVHTGSGAHPASCTMDTGGPLPGVNARPGRDADHSPISSDEVENEYELYSSPPCASIVYSGTALAVVLSVQTHL